MSAADLDVPQQPIALRFGEAPFLVRAEAI
jgi:hypothetical protein